MCKIKFYYKFSFTCLSLNAFNSSRPASGALVLSCFFPAFICSVFQPIAMSASTFKPFKLERSSHLLFLNMCSCVFTCTRKNVIRLSPNTVPTHKNSRPRTDEVTGCCSRPSPIFQYASEQSCLFLRLTAVPACTEAAASSGALKEHRVLS